MLQITTCETPNVNILKQKLRIIQLKSMILLTPCPLKYPRCNTLKHLINISEMRETSKIIDFTYPYIKPSKKFQHFEKSIYTPLFYPATYPNGVNGVCVFHCFLRIFHLKIGNQFTPQNTTNVVTTFVVFFL